jgi:hypothetical protein
MATPTHPQLVDLYKRLLKKDQPRIGVAVIQSPTNTITYIDASGQDETHTIMRAELAAIQVAFNTSKDEP